MLRHWGDDLADNARGIYYADDLRAIDKSKLRGETHEIDYVERRVLRYRNLCSFIRRHRLERADSKASEKASVDRFE